MKKLLIVLMLVCGSAVKAQSVKVYGQVLDSVSGPIPGATVMLVGAKDSILKSFSVSDKSGVFTLSNVKRGNYIFKVSFFGYDPYEQSLSIAENSQDTTVGKIQMQPKMLGKVDVKGHYVPIAIKGDTIEYDSRAFDTDEHDVVEDLLKQLPGLEVNEDGSIKAQGKDVEKVLVDGEEFFSDDPTIATKNLPANSVDKVQVFDKQSDMSEFTGIDDGNESTTINLKLKESHKKGTFGNLELAGGTDAPITSGEQARDYARYQAKGNIHYFKKNWQFSVIGMSNNINETGFSVRDYINFMGGVQNMMRDGGMSFNMDGGLPISRGGDSDDGFLNTNATGLNFNFRPSKQTVFNASVFFSNFDKTYMKELERETYLSDSSLFTTESVNQNSTTMNNRGNIHFEQKIDSTHFINFDLAGSWDLSDYFNGNNVENFNPQNELSSSFVTNLDQDNFSYDLNGTLDYRKKFSKPGRYTGGGVSYERSNNDGATTLDYVNDLYFSGVPISFETDQLQYLLQSTSEFVGSWMWSEPLGKRQLLQFEYAFRRNTSDRNKNVYDVDADGTETLNDFFSAEAEYLYYRQGGNIQHKFIGKKINTTLRATYQYLNLSGNDIFGIDTSKVFHHILPSFNLQWEPNKSSDFRFNYNTSLTVPTLNQLQALPDNSNPSEVIRGNTDLNPEYNHSVALSFHNFNEFNFMHFMARLTGTYTQNNIVYSQEVNEFLVRELIPENLGDERSANAYLSFGASLHSIFTKFNISNSASISNGLVNLNSDRDQYTSINTSPRLTVENIDKKIISFKTGVGYTWSTNLYRDNSTFNNQFNNFNYFANAKLKIKDRWVIQSDVTHYFYPDFENNSQQVILNARIGLNLLESKKLQIFLSGRDLLNQNTGINQYYFQNIYERETTTTLARYFMLGLKYSFHKLGAK